MTDAMKRRLFGLVALVAAGGALGWVSMTDMGDDLVYYWSPTELVESPKARDALVRLGGQVVPGTIDWNKDAGTVDFQITDGQNTVHVHSDGNPPQMFRDGIGVVVEGRLEGDVFNTQRVMVKHSNEYQAPEGEGHPNPYATLVQEDS